MSSKLSAPSGALPATLTHRELFCLFFKAGLAFGGGLAILGVLQNELVNRRKLVTIEEFLATYSLGRIVPTGTMTAIAIAYGYRFCGFLGTLNAITALTLPALSLTVLLTVGYQQLRASPVFPFIPVTLLPAALALIAIAAVQLGQVVFRPSLDVLLALAAFVGVIALNLNPAILLMAGGFCGALIFRSGRAIEQPPSA